MFGMSKLTTYGILLIVDIIIISSLLLLGPKISKHKVLDIIFDVVMTCLLAGDVIIFLMTIFK